jgi:hypothetical protein
VSGNTRIRPSAAALAALGGGGIIAGSFLTWVKRRGTHPSTGVNHTSVSEAVRWSYQHTGSFWTSVGVALLILGVLVIVAALTGSRTLAVLSSLLALGVTGTWLGLVATQLWQLKSLPWSGLREGAWLSLAGGILALLSAFFLRKQDRSTVESGLGGVARRVS